MLLLLKIACRKNNNYNEEINPQTGESKIVDVQITLPEGSYVFLSETKLVSFMEPYSVSNDGRSKSRCLGVCPTSFWYLLL